MKIILSICLFILISCSSTIETPRDPEHIYQGAGTEQYFLPELPTWANFSQVGKCQKSIPIRYLDYEKLSASYNLSYFENVQLQLSFNKSIERQKKNNEKQALFLKDEIFLFSNAYEQISGQAYEFRVPDFERLHLVWIDLALNDARAFEELKKVMRSNAMGQGYPIFVSSCLGESDLQTFIDRNFSNLGIKKISAEFFAPYNLENKKTAGLGLNLQAFLKEKIIILYGPNSYPPVDLTGFNEYKKF